MECPLETCLKRHLHFTDGKVRHREMKQLEWPGFKQAIWLQVRLSKPQRVKNAGGGGGGLGR